MTFTLSITAPVLANSSYMHTGSLSTESTKQASSSINIVKKKKRTKKVSVYKKIILFKMFS